MAREKRCRQCGYQGKDVSYNGLCPKCQIKNIHEAARQMHDRKGPMYENWKRNLKKAMERITGG